LRIAIADDEADMRYYLQKILPLLGHEVVAVAENGKQLVEQCRTSHPDLVITDIKMPELDGIEAAGQCSEDGPVPVILVSAYHDPELVDRVKGEHILAFLVKPITQADLVPAICLVMRPFEQFQMLSREAADLRQALEDWKLIERAKRLVTKQVGVAEQEAFRRLKKLASDRNRKLVEIARLILSSEETFQALDRS